MTAPTIPLVLNLTTKDGTQLGELTAQLPVKVTSDKHGVTIDTGGTNELQSRLTRAAEAFLDAFENDNPTG